MVVDGVSFEVRGGEILGIAGVQGNGQTELAEALTGLRTAAAGQVIVNGQDTTRFTPRKLVEGGMAHIPEDRHKHGLVLAYPVRDNIVLCTYYRAPFADGVELDYPAITEEAETLVKMYDVRTPGIMTTAGSLSGGNQQKVIVARELSRITTDEPDGRITRNPPFLIASQPTRGLDVGSIEFIHRRIVEARDMGAAVLLISAELDEIMALSDRIAVMYKGHNPGDAGCGDGDARATRFADGRRDAGSGGRRWLVQFPHPVQGMGRRSRAYSAWARCLACRCWRCLRRSCSAPSSSGSPAAACRRSSRPTTG